MSGLLILHSPGALSANHAHSHTRILPTLIPCSLVEHVQSKSPGAKDVQTQLRAQCPPLLFNVRKQVKEIQEERERRRLEEERIKAAAEAERERLREAERKRIAAVELKLERQRQLRARGVCSAGYEWQENPSHPNYRCAGGGHFCTFRWWH